MEDPRYSDRGMKTAERFTFAFVVLCVVLGVAGACVLAYQALT